MKMNKNSLQEIIPWKQYVNYARMGQITSTYITHFNQLLETAGKQEYVQPTVTFKDMVEEIYFDSADIPYDIYKEEYE